MHPDPNSSPAKVRRVIADAFAQLPALQQQLSGMQAVMFAPLMGFAPQLQRMALDHLPDDPQLLDALLDRAAALVLSMKSDEPAIDVDAVPA